MGPYRPALGKTNNLLEFTQTGGNGGRDRFSSASFPRDFAIGWPGDGAAIS
jgi:hypothetical protein